MSSGSETNRGSNRRVKNDSQHSNGSHSSKTSSSSGNKHSKNGASTRKKDGSRATSSQAANIEEIKSFFKTIAVFIVAAIFLRATVIEAFKIPSGSMIPTLEVGDHILVSKFNYGIRLPLMKKSLIQYATPERGDIVVFTLPDDKSTKDKDESKINIIKRVVGLPGETIEVRRGKVMINNKAINEPYARWEEGGSGENITEVVPEGHVFMLGDNRDKSRDSRYWTDPFLDISRIKGRALVVYWSWDSFSRIGKIIR